MSTEISGNMGSKRDFIREDGRIEDRYPLYWLAPVIDQGVRMVKLCSLSDKTMLKHEEGCKLFHLPRQTKLLKLLLTVMGFKRSNGKEPLVKIAKIENSCIVEAGQPWVRLAALLKLDCIPARVVRYDYTSLKKRMRLFLNHDGALVGISGRQKDSCNYYGVCHSHREVLIHQHRIPYEDLLTAVERKTVAGMGGLLWAAGNRTAKRRSNLVLIKK